MKSIPFNPSKHCFYDIFAFKFPESSEVLIFFSDKLRPWYEKRFKLTMKEDACNIGLNTNSALLFFSSNFPGN